MQILTATERSKVGISDNSTQSVILNRLGEAQAASIHQSIAEKIESRNEPDAIALLEHWQGAGNRPKAADSALKGARQANEKLAFDLEAELYYKALELRQRGVQDWRLMVSRAAALANSNRGVEAGETYNSAVAAAESCGETETLGLRAEASRQLLCAGAVEPGIETLRDMLDTANLKWPRTVVHAAADIGLNRAANAFTNLTGLSLSPQVVTRDIVDSCWAAIMGLNSVDAVRSASFEAKRSRLANKLGDPIRNVRALASEAMFRTAEGGSTAIAGSEKELQHAHKLAKQSNDKYAMAFVELSSGVSAYFACQWSQAVSRLGNELESFEQLNGVAWEISNCRLWRLSALYWSGDLTGLLAEQEATLRRALVEDNVNFKLAANSGHGNFVRILRNKVELAVTECESAVDPFRGDSFTSPYYAELVTRMHIDLYQGNPVAAYIRFSDLQPTLLRSGLLRLGIFGVEANLLGANASISLAQQGHSTPQSIRSAKQAIKRLYKSSLPITQPLAAILNLLLEQSTGTTNRQASSHLLKHAEKMEDLNFNLLAWATRMAANTDSDLPSQNSVNAGNLSGALLPSPHFI